LTTINAPLGMAPYLLDARVALDRCQAMISA